MTQKTIAETISAQLNDDGQCWETSDGKTLEQLCAAASVRRDYRDSHGTKVLVNRFSDDSSIVETGGGWDLGYPHCYCWRGVGHSDDCVGGSTTVEAGDVHPSTCAEGAWDVDITLTIPGGTTVEGQCTLAPAAYDGRPASWGDGGLEPWLEHTLIEVCERQDTDDLPLCDTLASEIEHVAAEAILADDVPASAEEVLHVSEEGWQLVSEDGYLRDTSGTTERLVDLKAQLVEWLTNCFEDRAGELGAATAHTDIARRAVEAALIVLGPDEDTQTIGGLVVRIEDRLTDDYVEECSQNHDPDGGGLEDWICRALGVQEAKIDAVGVVSVCRVGHWHYLDAEALGAAVTAIAEGV